MYVNKNPRNWDDYTGVMFLINWISKTIAVEVLDFGPNSNCQYSVNMWILRKLKKVSESQRCLLWKAIEKYTVFENHCNHQDMVDVRIR